MFIKMTFYYIKGKFQLMFTNFSIRDNETLPQVPVTHRQFKLHAPTNTSHLPCINVSGRDIYKLITCLQ